jgi:hypothetical protein
MSRAAETAGLGRGAQLLLVHCAALDEAGPASMPVVDRLRQLIGPELTRLLLVALAGDHRMRSRGLAA